MHLQIKVHRTYIQSSDRNISNKFGTRLKKKKGLPTKLISSFSNSSILAQIYIIYLRPSKLLMDIYFALVNLFRPRIYSSTTSKYSSVRACFLYSKTFLKDYQYSSILVRTVFF